MPTKADIASLAELEARLIQSFGGVIGGKDLTRLLGYRSQAAFRQAVARQRLAVPVFTLEGRRGKFARAHDVAYFLYWAGRQVPVSGA